MPHLVVSQKTNGFDTSHPQNDAHPLAMNILEWTSVLSLSLLRDIPTITRDPSPSDSS